MEEVFLHKDREQTRILILGAGFGGIRAALNLAKYKLKNTRVTIVSDKHHFGYTPALYKLATGRSPMETCIPLGEIFDGYDIEWIVDPIVGGSVLEKVMYGKSGSRYKYDFLILALGAESSYFGIPGVAEHSFKLKSVYTALRLKTHIHGLFQNTNGLSKGEMMARFQFVIVGGGPAGVELAGEVRTYARKLAKAHDISEKYITVDILQAAPRLLPTMSEEVSKRALHQLNKLGINIMLNRAVTNEDEKGVYLKDIEFNAKTIIWTAGVRPSHVYSSIEGLTLDKSGHILVDEHMRLRYPAEGEGLEASYDECVFIIGDSASTPFAGTAQTAMYDGNYVATAIVRTLRGLHMHNYKPQKTPYVVPIGEDWAIFTYKNITLSGRIYWWLRQFIDLKFFFTILPFWKAITIWREGGKLSESCPTCKEAEIQSHSH
ncbi:MAG: NAD(P)/FAD-dependent oxidoreductase [Candidatus Pacebacteria bacterium]|nr:NAD(P)/FAD-dependent oxidoreductase [Candidatus Paceibacterota bacterium]